MPLSIRKKLLAGAISLGATMLSIVAITLPAAANAQIAVFDPSNYSQNVLTAARSLQLINNQVQSLQNQAQSLINQGKNLTTIGFPELQALRQTLQQIDQLMGQAQRIEFRVANLDQQFRSMFPTSFNQLLTNSQHAAGARSQSAQGALQVGQATNQLLALVAKQQFQIQTLMAAQYRADAIERANRTQAQSDAQAATAKFLGSGTAYTPH